MISASARCTAVSCAIRRAQNPAGRFRPRAHTVASPASLTVAISSAAPSRSQPGRCAGSSGRRPSGTLRNGMNSADRVAAISAAHRCARPTCVTSCRSVQPGQVGTGRARSSWLARAASVPVLAVISAWYRSAVSGLTGGAQPQPQAPPQHPPPPPERGWAALARPPTETVDSSLTVSSCPCGHGHGSDASLIGRLRSNVDPHARQRYS